MAEACLNFFRRETTPDGGYAPYPNLKFHNKTKALLESRKNSSVTMSQTNGGSSSQEARSIWVRSTKGLVTPTNHQTNQRACLLRIGWKLSDKPPTSRQWEVSVGTLAQGLIEFCRPDFGRGRHPC